MNHLIKVKRQKYALEKQRLKDLWSEYNAIREPLGWKTNSVDILRINREAAAAYPKLEGVAIICNELWEEIWEEVATSAVKSLDRILDNIRPTDIILRAYKASLSSKINFDERVDGQEIIVLLEEIPEQPLHKFVNYLIFDDDIRPDVKLALKEWMEQQGWDILEPPPVDISLMLKVIKSFESESYEVDARYVENQKQSRYSSSEDQLFTDILELSCDCKANLPLALKEAVRICNEKYRVANKNLFIEWFLPVELMHLPVDQWPILDEACSSGQLCKSVVIRVCDQKITRAKLALPDKMEFWKCLEARPENVCLDALEMLDIIGGQRFGARENNQTIGYRFCASSDQQQQEAFWKSFLQEGLPVALWIRDSSMYPSDVEILMQALNNKAIGTLPIDLTNHRRSGKILGVEHVSLLWDNPFRPFPGSEPLHSQNIPKY
jgi:hypothetical protein